MHIEDQVCRAAVEVGDFNQGAARSVRDEGTRRGEVSAGKENLVASGTGLTDCGDGCLDGGVPCIDVEVMLWRMLVCVVQFHDS